MRISAIQRQITNQPKPIEKRVINHRNTNIPTEQTQPITPSFKGNGDGALAGLGGGLIAGLLIFAGGAITGGVAVPAIVGSLGVLGLGAGGAYAGDKIEDAIKGKGKKD